MLFDAVHHLFLRIDGQKHLLDRHFQMASTSRV